MKESFDFDDIGKKMPYRVPEGFFDEMQRNVQKCTYGGRPGKRRLWMVLSTGTAIAAMLVGFLFIPSHYWRGDDNLKKLDVSSCTAVTPTDKWIHEMSDEELEELVNFSENDLFLN